MKKSNRIAERIITGFLTVKVPIGYAFIRNARGLIESKMGTAPTDDQLESIASRFLDLALFYLTQPDEGGNFKMPTSDDFFKIVEEVMGGDDGDSDEEYDEFFDDEEDGNDPEGRF